MIKIENLISKKELLEITGISYGQLYRWKRKNLIPEEWFIKKSSFTGQETYLPKDQILERIEKIKGMKDERSLEDLADLFSSSKIIVGMAKDELIKRNIVSLHSLNFFEQTLGEKSALDFNSILFVFIVNQLFESGEINLEEGKIILEMLDENYLNLSEEGVELLIMRKYGVSFCALKEATAKIYIDRNAKIIAQININTIVEKLKIILSDETNNERY